MPTGVLGAAGAAAGSTLAGGALGAMGALATVGVGVLSAKISGAIARAREHQLMENISDSIDNQKKYNQMLASQLDGLRISQDMKNTIMSECAITNTQANGRIFPVCLELYNDFINHASDGWFDELVDEAHGYYKDITLGILLYLQSEGVVNYDGDLKRYTLNGDEKLSQGAATMLMFGNTLAVLIDQLTQAIKFVPSTPEELLKKTGLIDEWNKKISHFITESFKNDAGLLALHRTTFGSFFKGKLLGLQNRRILAMQSLVASIEEAEQSKREDTSVAVLSPIEALTKALIAKAELDYAKSSSVELLKSTLTSYDLGYTGLVSATQTQGDSVAALRAPTPASTYRAHHTIKENKARNVLVVDDLSENKAYVQYIGDCFDSSGVIISLPAPKQPEFHRIGATKGVAFTNRNPSCNEVSKEDSQASMDLTLSKVILEKTVSMLCSAYDKEVTQGRAQSPLAYYFLKQIQFGLNHIQHVQSLIASNPLEGELIKRSAHYYESESRKIVRNTTVTLGTSEERSSIRSKVDIKDALTDPYVSNETLPSEKMRSSAGRKTWMLEEMCSSAGSTFCTMKRQELGWQVRSKNLVKQLLDQFVMDRTLTTVVNDFKVTDPRAKALTMMASLDSAGTTQSSINVKNQAKDWFVRSKQWLEHLAASSASVADANRNETGDNAAALRAIMINQNAASQAMADVIQKSRLLVTKVNEQLATMNKTPSILENLRHFQKDLYLPFVPPDSESKKPGYFVLLEEKMITLFSYYSVSQSLNALVSKLDVGSKYDQLLADLNEAAETLPKQKLEDQAQSRKEAFKTEESRQVLKQENQALLEKVDRLTIDLAKVSEEKAHLVSELETAKVELTTSKGTIEQLSVEMLSLKDQLDFQKKSMEDVDAKFKEAGDKLTSVVEKNETLTLEMIEAFKAQQQKCIGEATVLLNANTSITQTMNELKEKYERLQQDSLNEGEAKSWKEIIDASITLMTGTTNTLDLSYQKMLSWSKDLENKISSYQNKMAELSGEAKSALEQLQSAQAQFNLILAQVNAIQVTLKTCQETLLAHSKQLLDVSNRLSKLEVSSNSSNKENDLDLSMAESQDNKGAPVIQLSKTAKASDAYNAKNQAMQAQIEKLQAALKEWKICKDGNKSAKYFENKTGIEVLNALVGAFYIALVHRSNMVISAHSTKSSVDLANKLLPMNDPAKLKGFIDLLRGSIQYITKEYETKKITFKFPHCLRLITEGDVNALVSKASPHCLTAPKLAKIMKAIVVLQYGLCNDGAVPSFTGGGKKVKVEEWSGLADNIKILYKDGIAHRSGQHVAFAPSTPAPLLLSEGVTQTQGQTSPAAAPEKVGTKPNVPTDTAGLPSPGGQGGASDDDSDDDHPRLQS